MTQYFSDRVRDGQMATALRGGSDNMGVPLTGGPKVINGKVVDSTGSFYLSQLGAHDITVHAPMFETTYTRDLPLRTDVQIGHANTSFTQQSWSAAGITASGGGVAQKRSFIGQLTNEITGVEIDSALKTSPLMPWAKEAKYTIMELQSSALLGQGIDLQKIDAIAYEFQMQLDAQAYLGWTGNQSFGLLNNPQVKAMNVPVGASGSTSWSSKTGNEIITDLANMILTFYAQTGYSRMPNKILIDATSLAVASAKLVAVNGTGVQSSIKYFLENNLAALTGQKIEIVIVKYLQGMSGGGVNNIFATGANSRCVVYRQEEDWRQAPIRLPFIPLDRTPLQYDGLWQKIDFFTKFGTVEFVYPQAAVYYDGL